jgi:nucleoside-diphosphate-sugar epimerase
MKILLTGAGGFLGQQIARSLLLQGVTDLRLHVRNKAPAGLVQRLQSEFPKASIEVAAANLLAPATLPGVMAGVDTVVHAAAGMKGAAADMFANTVIGSRNVFDAAGLAGIRRLVLISSFAVYKTDQMKAGDTLDGSTPIEPVGVEKGPYGYAKTRQEHLLGEMKQRYGYQTVVLRPGVIYGPGGGALSPRVGLNVMGWFFSLGGAATLPLTFVENCADAVASATLHAADGAAFSVVDDELPSCKAYLNGYRSQVRKLRVIPVPSALLRWGAKQLVAYHKRSRGQLPAVFTPYVVRSMYTPLTYSNTDLKRIGWSQRVPTRDALRITYGWLKANQR